MPLFCKTLNILVRVLEGPGRGSGRPARRSGGHPEVLEASRRVWRPVRGAGDQPEGLGGQPEGLEASLRAWEASQRVWRLAWGGGGGRRNGETENQNLPVWYRRSSAPSGSLPKRKQRLLFLALATWKRNQRHLLQRLSPDLVWNFNDLSSNSASSLVCEFLIQSQDVFFPFNKPDA